MAVTTTVRTGAIDVEIRGLISHLIHFSGDHHLPVGDVVDARVVGWDDVRPELGWRVGGGYWPGGLATGWFTMPGRRGARQFLSVFRDRDRLLCIDTRLQRPARLVLAVPDPEAAVDAIVRQIGR
jgi:hypothetical protein